MQKGTRFPQFKTRDHNLDFFSAVISAQFVPWKWFLVLDFGVSGRNPEAVPDRSAEPSGHDRPPLRNSARAGELRSAFRMAIGSESAILPP
eukprot:361166-Rhodomonas_salina.1